MSKIKCKKQQIGWFGHLTRMDKTRLEKTVWEMRQLQRKCKARPRNTWNKAKKLTLTEIGMLWTQAKKTALDRTMWRRITTSTTMVEKVSV